MASQRPISPCVAEQNAGSYVTALAPLHEQSRHRQMVSGGLLVLCGLVALVVFSGIQAHAQGCAQCLDSTRATPPQVQAAYRHAILLMAGFAASLFVAGMFFLRKQ